MSFVLPECTFVNSFVDGLRNIRQGDDAVVFEEKDCFLVNEQGVFGIDHKDRWFHEYTIPRKMDVMKDIRSNVEFDVMMNGVIVKNIDCIMFCVAPYTEFSIRFYITKDLLNEEIHLDYKSILFSHHFRNRIIGACPLQIGGLSYEKGSCTPLFITEE